MKGQNCNCAMMHYRWVEQRGGVAEAGGNLIAFVTDLLTPAGEFNSKVFPCFPDGICTVNCSDSKWKNHKRHVQKPKPFRVNPPRRRTTKTEELRRADNKNEEGEQRETRRTNPENKSLIWGPARGAPKFNNHFSELTDRLRRLRFRL